MNYTFSSLASVALIALALASACSGEAEPPDDTSTGGASSGGSSNPGVGGTGGTAAGGTSSGGSGTGGDVGIVIEPSFETLKLVISGHRPDVNCAASDCHSGGHDHAAVPLRLIVDDELYTELTTHVSVKCGNMPVVDPGHPENSALVKLLKGPCEDVDPPEKPIPRMPYGCFEDEWENNCIADEYIAAIEQWIADGAPEQ